jgi:hypothetical protein
MLVEDDRATARALRDKYGVRYVLMSDQLVVQVPGCLLAPVRRSTRLATGVCGEFDTRREARGLPAGGCPFLHELGTLMHWAEEGETG